MMKPKLLTFICVFFVLVLTIMGIPGCKTLFSPGAEYIEIKANPATLELSKQTSTTITVRIFDPGSDRGYKVEFTTTDGGYFSDDIIHLFGQTSTATQFYPANLTGGDTQKIVTIRARVMNLETNKDYTGEVRITVR